MGLLSRIKNAFNSRSHDVDYDSHDRDEANIADTFSYYKTGHIRTSSPKDAEVCEACGFDFTNATETRNADYDRETGELLRDQRWIELSRTNLIKVYDDAAKIYLALVEPQLAGLYPSWMDFWSLGLQNLNAYAHGSDLSGYALVDADAYEMPPTKTGKPQKYPIKIEASVNHCRDNPSYISNDTISSDDMYVATMRLFYTKDGKPGRGEFISRNKVVIRDEDIIRHCSAADLCEFGRRDGELMLLRAKHRNPEANEWQDIILNN